jgi:endonuclease VIII
MPEGPSIVILKEEAQPFSGKKVTKASGTTKEDISDITGKKIKAFKSWGKHFLICFPKKTIRIHFLLFGSYRINESRPVKPRLSLQFANGEMNFYACAVKVLDQDPDEIYDWSSDVMNDKWDSKKAKTQLLSKPGLMVCDALLDQTIFSGVGNIIKNEVLFRVRVHPESRVGKLPSSLLSAMIRETRKYSFEFLKWKKAFTLKKHWRAHTKTVCPRCGSPLTKKYTGKTKRRSFFCKKCQQLYK